MVTQSLLDRLMTVDDWPSTRAQSHRYLKEALRRDLEWLLNTRQPPFETIANYPLASASVVNFGLPDISSLGLISPSDSRRLRLAIEICLRNFEPRLANVRVSFEGGAVTDRLVRFHVEGMLRVDPAPEEISFDTVLELSSGEFKVR